MNTNRPSRWNFEAVVNPNDKIRLRGFIKNEISYYNAVLAGFASRLRTMPEIFDEVNDELLGEIAAQGYNLRVFTPDTLPKALQGLSSVIFADGKLALSDRLLLLLDVVSVAAILHAEARRAIAIEMLVAHRKQADGLKRTTSRLDQVLAAPVELLQPVEPRIKRHIQLPRKAVTIANEGRTIITAYNGVPIVMRPGSLPNDAAWNVMVIRDDERQGTGGWSVEFRTEPNNYLLRLTDAPMNTKKKRREVAR
jgi:hypothetical protein